MSILSLKLDADVKLDKFSRKQLKRIADSLEVIQHLISAQRIRGFKLTIEDLMPVYSETREDFDFRVRIVGTDAEGGVNTDSPIPAGFSLEVASDNPDAFSVAQDAADPRLVHAHVGSAFDAAGATPTQAFVTANLFDADGNLVATGASQVTVVVGEATSVTEIALDLPTA